jgi:hypothetical protein
MHCKYRILRKCDGGGDVVYVAQRKRRGQWFWRTAVYEPVGPYKFLLLPADIGGFNKYKLRKLEYAKRLLQHCEWQGAFAKYNKLRRKAHKTEVVCTMPPWNEEE